MVRRSGCSQTAVEAVLAGVVLLVTPEYRRVDLCVARAAFTCAGLSSTTSCAPATSRATNVRW
jgi:hypothetical protein